MDFAGLDHRFPTMVVGSLPRPAWLLDRWEKQSDPQVIARRNFDFLPEWYKTERPAERPEPLDPSHLTRLLDLAVPFAIALQETAGIDVISDGEWRRPHFHDFISRSLEGFVPLKVRGYYSAVVAPIEVQQSLTAAEAQFLLSHSSHPVKIALPSPYLLARRMYDPVVSARAYPTREAFMTALVPILRQELITLRDLGVAMVQFDDPELGVLVDPARRADVEDPDRDLAVAIDCLNQVVDGISGVTTALHICRAVMLRGWGAEGGYEAILPGLYRSQVDLLMLEFAMPVAGGVEIFGRYPTERKIGLGVVDIRTQTIEGPQVIIERVERALRYLHPDQLVLHPDCGFAPSSILPIPLDEPYFKLRALGIAAERLREKYG
ncbi:MAG TPA: cobalamin-independent methionine synthase II family protein [Chloroflexota bacterium]